MSDLTRRAVLAALPGLVALAGCSGRRDASERTTHPPQTARPGWVGLEVENNDDAPREVAVAVEFDGEVRFERTLSLRPQAEPEFNSVVPLPDSGARSVRVRAEMSEGASASATFTVAPGQDPQRLYVTVDREGNLRLTQGTEPSEPIRTTDGA